MSRNQLSGAIAYQEGQGLNQVRRWRAFAVLAVSFFMTIADLAIVNVALPTIGRKLHMPESALQWVVTGYALTFGGFLLLGGRAADLLGRRRILMIGLFVFTAASLGCGLATSEGFLIAMRFLQGLGAAIVLPAALSIVMNMFPEGAERNKALGVWGAVGASGATVGVLAGGLLLIARAMVARSEVFTALTDLMQRFYVLAAPAAQVVPFPVEQEYPSEVAGVTMPHYLGWMRVCSRITVSAHPVAAVPAGFTGGGLPVGMQFVGRYRGDRGLLEHAAAWETATGLTQRHPTLD